MIPVAPAAPIKSLGQAFPFPLRKRQHYGRQAPWLASHQPCKFGWKGLRNQLSTGTALVSTHYIFINCSHTEDTSARALGCFYPLLGSGWAVTVPSRYGERREKELTSSSCVFTATSNSHLLRPRLPSSGPRRSKTPCSFSRSLRASCGGSCYF